MSEEDKAGNEKIEEKLIETLPNDDKIMLPKNDKQKCIDNLINGLIRFVGYWYPIVFFFAVINYMEGFFKIVLWVVNGIIIIISLMSVVFMLNEKLMGTGSYIEYKKTVYKSFGRGEEVEDVQDISNKTAVDNSYVASGNYTFIFLTMSVVITPAVGLYNIIMFFYYAFRLLFRVGKNKK